MTTAARPRQVSLAGDDRISEVIVGGWQFSSGHRSPPLIRAEAVEHLMTVVDAGFTTLDCADIYTGVEELFGDLRREYHIRRGAEAEPLRIHTKFVPDLDALPNVDRGYVERIIDRSLRRLGVERLDLVQFHWWDDRVPGALDTAGWLVELQRAGKIKHLGVTNFDVMHLQQLRDAGIPIVSNQVQYSIVDSRPERGLVAYCAAHGIKLLTYGTLAGGFLTTRYVGQPEPAHPLATRSLTKYMLMVNEVGGWDALQQVLDTAHSLAQHHGVEVESVATRFVLDQAAVAACIVGVTKPEHLRGALATCNLTLSEKDHERMRSALGRLRVPPGNVFELERYRDGPHGRIMRYNLNSADA